MARVYVSSTIADLERERRAVLDWLRAARHQAVDSYLPDSETMRDSCLGDVDTCDLYVLILGHRYGFRPSQDNPEGLSITQLEFRRAGQSGIPRIALLRTSIPDVSVSDIANPQQAALVFAFRDEVAREVRAAEFADERGLIQGLSTGVQGALEKQSAASLGGGRVPVSWPWRVGVVPGQAECFQLRAAAGALDAAIAGGGTAVLCQVLAGTGGVGKTQLAAAYARAAWQAGSVDLLAWVTAGSRDAVLGAYAQAGAEVARADPGDPEVAAGRFLTWLETTDRRWLVVLDDLADPADVRGLWPPASSRGRVLVTTRRRDAALAGQGRRLVNVGLFTPVEAAAYLTANLAAHDLTDRADQVAGLAADLGFLPLALAQAAAYLTDLGLDCARYRERLADRRHGLPDLVPDDSGLPDDHRAALAATWSLSIEQADRLRPAGLARPMLELASMLDPNGIPEAVLTSAPAQAYLTEHRTGSTDRAAGSGIPDARGQADAGYAADALRCLSRLSLAELDAAAPHQPVRVHSLIQRATRESLPEARRGPLARAAADALLAAWPDVERDTALGQALRSSATILAGHAAAELWQRDAHPVLFRAGRSLGEAGLIEAAIAHWQDLHATAVRCLGPEHPDTLTTRHNLAHWQGQAGNPVGAAAAFKQLLADSVRVLGPDHPDTLAARGNLARWRGEAGDPAAAAAAYAEVLADSLRVLGPDHPDTLRTRGNLARWRGEAGDPVGAAAAFKKLLADSLRVLGPDHPDTLRTRRSLIAWRGHAGHPADAVSGYRELLADYLRVLGPDHPETLRTRGHLALWRGEAGDGAGAVAGYQELLADRLRVLGPDHPSTLSTRGSLAHRRGQAGDPAGAAAAAGELLADYLRVLGPDHPDTLRARLNLAQQRGQAGDPAGAAAAYRELLADRLRVQGPDHPDTLATRHSLAHWQGQAGDAAGAVAAFEKVVADCLRVLGPNHPNTLLARHYLADWRGEAGDLTGAAAAYEELLADRLRVLGPDHPDTLGGRHGLAYWRGKAGDPAGAASGFEELLADTMRVLGPDHPNTLGARISLARWRGEAGDPAGAAAASAEVVADHMRVQGPDHPDTLRARISLARWRGEAGDPAGAAADFDKVVVDCLRVLGADHPSTLNARGNLAYWCGKAGDPAGAAAASAEVLADCLRVLGPDHPDTLATRHSLAYWKGQTGDPVGAAADFEELLADCLRVLGPDHPATIDSRRQLAYWTEQASSGPGPQAD